MPDKLLTDAQVREMFGGISSMTLHRWRHAAPPKIPFPAPVRINGRNYNPEDGLTDYMQAQADAAAPVSNIPNAEEGRAIGREKLSIIYAAKKAQSATSSGGGEITTSALIAEQEGES